jgi:enoyl-CoA hydratase
MADRIAACAPLAVQAILRAVRETEHLPEEEALKVSDEIGWPVFATEDAKEGSKAFKEKRPPVYRGE